MYRFIFYFPIMILLLSSCAKEDKSVPFSGTIVYASTEGNDNNPGTLSLPLRSLQKTMEVAAENGVNEIRIGSGFYKRGDGLDQYATTGLSVSGNDLTISGGWNTNFSSIDGMSVILNNGSQSLRGIDITGATNIHLRNFVISGCYIYEYRGNGSGMRIQNSSFCTISNIAVSNCYASATGGGIALENSDNLTLQANIISNKANTDNGGGIVSYNTRDSSLYLILEKNFAYGGSGVYLYTARNINLDVQARNNIGETCRFVLVSDVVMSGTITSNQGTGIELWGSTNVTLSCQSTYNIKDSYGGGGVIMNYSSNIRVSGEYSYNTSSNGGGLNIYESTGIYVTATINSNYASSTGGGFNIGGDGLTIVIISNSIINGNTSSSRGGALYLSGGNTARVIENEMLWNSAGGNGIIYLTQYNGWSDLSFIGNTIGGRSGNEAGLMAYAGFAGGHVLRSNIFITNDLNYLYFSYANGGTSSINAVNNPSWTYATSDSTNNTETGY